MDMHLPRLSGLETIAIVRQIKGLIPTILISADRDDNLLRRALSEHAFCVLAKPVSKHVVIYVVTKGFRNTTIECASPPASAPPAELWVCPFFPRGPGLAAARLAA